ncbi:rod shape-determining protein MreD [Hydrogenovibrio kuenenii]|uniref:rod shape-determining protein MreD n=1 Tax=Hydrogenovibrio kuenenii TaxID=63658 RepID=UPI000467B44D|nr:rod shape-determining protein MreD [Hydrogenovibrio kuenenii]
MTDKVFSLGFSDVKWLLLFSYLGGLVIDSALNFSFALHYAPPITLLLLLFWSSQILNQTHLFTAVVLGLLNDASLNTLLGAHAILFLTVTFFMLRIRLRFKGYPMWQQSIVVAFYVLFFQVAGWFIFHPALDNQTIYYYWLEPVFAIALWPLVSNIMQSLTQRALFR